MLRTREREKLLNALIFFSENVSNPSKTKLFKLLNYLDFLHYQTTGRSVTGLKYYAWERGPVPVALYNEWRSPKKDFNEHFRTYTRTFGNGWTSQFLQPRQGFDDKYFSPYELELMEALAKKHFRHNARDMSEDSHFETGPWHEIYEVQNSPSAEIPYELNLLRRGNEEDMEILETAKEYKEIRENYG